MTREEKEVYVNDLFEELLCGGAILSEWATFLAKDAINAFTANASLSSILACQAAIESHMRFDFFVEVEVKNLNFFQLIENSSLDINLKEELHQLRKYRNKWGHVNEPSKDEALLKRPKYFEIELELMAKQAIKTMLKVLLKNQGI